MLKHWFEAGQIVYYNKYVDDILTIFNQEKTDENQICTRINKLHQHLEFKPTKEDNGKINHLDLPININDDALTIEIYRKPTNTYPTMHYASNHPMEHKIAA
jgi:hypothetical protein